MILNKNILLISEDKEASDFVLSELTSTKNLSGINKKVERLLYEYQGIENGRTVYVSPTIINIAQSFNVIKTLKTQIEKSQPISLIIFILEDKDGINYELIKNIKDITENIEIIVATTKQERRKSKVANFIENTHSILFVRNVYDEELLVQLYENLTVKWALDSKLRRHIVALNDNQKRLEKIIGYIGELEKIEQSMSTKQMEKILQQTLDFLGLNSGLIVCEELNVRVGYGNYIPKDIEEYVRNNWYELENINNYREYIVGILFYETKMFGYLILNLENKDISESTFKYLEILISHANIIIRNTKLYKKVETKNIELEDKNLKLNRSNALNNKFLILSSHELRTPITLISGYSQILDKKFYSTEKEAQEIHGKLKNSSDRLLNILNNMLEINILNNYDEQLVLNVEECTIDSIFNELNDEINDYLKVRKQKVVLKKINKIPNLVIDKNKLKNFILFNLIINAIKYSEDGQEIIVKVKYDDFINKIRIYIEDFGVGISQEEMNKIFSPFYVINDYKSHHSGTYEFLASGIGLGLTIVKKTLKIIGEDIYIKRKKQGTIFYFDFPINQDSESTYIVDRDYMD